LSLRLFAAGGRLLVNDGLDGVATMGHVAVVDAVIDGRRQREAAGVSAICLGELAAEGLPPGVN